MNDNHDDNNVDDDDGDDDDVMMMMMRPCQGWSHVTPLNFKISRVSVYKCLSLIVGFAVTVAIWPREVVSCRDFILRAVATFWAMSLVGIYPGRASMMTMMMMINFVPRVRLDDEDAETKSARAQSQLMEGGMFPTFNLSIDMKFIC